MGVVVHKTKLILTMVGNFLNEISSFIVFTLLDFLDLILCHVYKVADFLAEAEWKPCYCSSPREAISGGGAKILVSERGESRIVRLTSTKLELEQISDTLYARPSLVSELSRSSSGMAGRGARPSPAAGLSVNSTVVEMLRERIGRQQKVPVPRWSDCDCATCTAWTTRSSLKETLFPYFPAPKGEQATQHMMRRVAPRRVWPPIAFGASIACWYEHISRTICLVICKNHRLWEFLTKLLTRNRLRTYLMEGFFLHTHNAAWHTLHNIICGTAGKIEGYLDEVNSQLKCDVTIFHGNDDELIPVECSYNVQSRISRARVKVVQNKDHITIVVGRQRAFARELEGIWKNAGR
ncbi:alpha/beta-Hydrolases superfamily protein [Striga asiatica]|uniref:Alpha/beta-Hydrolases superfamily protein n=1 Tax=Striga asiatica TaxID=4170 RepID=A0A5A7NZD5_STRAF|nr:alpha/beta-Hydrolases superfamily protein [Striga asiatica]